MPSLKNCLSRTRMEQQVQLGPYFLRNPLGAGTTGKVKLAIHSQTQKKYAIKIIKKDSFNDRPNLLEKIQREIALMKLVDHPHILKLADFLESPRHFYIVLEYASRGELFDYLVENKVLSEDVAIRFFRQIIYGLEYLHSLGICHRDLKPENILLDENLNIKIADFGFARFVKSNIAQTSCGSPHYAAPEVIRGQPYDGRAADIWSCGVILYALMAGYLPFDDSSVRVLLNKVKKGIFTMPPFSDQAKDLISRLLTLDPASRITIPQIKQHPFFRMNLPYDYVPPTPIPFPNFVQPIDPSTVSYDIIDILKKIGYNDEQELRNDFISSTHSMAKVFYYMLTTRVSFDQLDWSLSVDANAQHQNHPNEEEIMLNPTEQSFTVNVAGSDPFHRYGSSDQSLEAGNSFANAADWSVPDTPPMDIIQTFEIRINGIFVAELMRLIQVIVRNFGMQWFFPDDFTIISRSEQTGGYIIFQCANQQSEIDILLTLQLFEGNLEEFTHVCRAVEEIIAGNKTG